MVFHNGKTFHFRLIIQPALVPARYDYRRSARTPIFHSHPQHSHPRAKATPSMTSMPSTRFTRRTLALAAAAPLGLSTAAMAQDIQERTIKFGHLNNPDHPTSLGVKQVRRAGGRQERRQDQGAGIPGLASWATNCSSSRRCRAACRKCWSPPPRRWPASSRNSACSTFPSSVSQCATGRCAGRRPAGQDADRQAAGEGPGRAGLLGPGLSQRHQQQAPHHQGARTWRA